MADVKTEVKPKYHGCLRVSGCNIANKPLCLHVGRCMWYVAYGAMEFFFCCYCDRVFIDYLFNINEFVSVHITYLTSDFLLSLSYFCFLHFCTAVTDLTDHKKTEKHEKSKKKTNYWLLFWLVKYNKCSSRIKVFPNSFIGTKVIYLIFSIFKKDTYLIILTVII